MKYMKKLGLISTAMITLLTLFAVVLPPQKASAITIKQSSIRDLGGNDGAKRIADSMKITFIDRGHIRVELNISDSLFTDLSLPTISYGEAFSGDYVDTNVDDSKSQWEQPSQDLVPGKEGLSVRAKIRADNFPRPEASAQDFEAWAQTAASKSWDDQVKSAGLGIDLAVSNKYDGWGDNDKAWHLTNLDSDGHGFDWREYDGGFFENTYRSIPINKNFLDVGANSTYAAVSYVFKSDQIFHVNRLSEPYSFTDSSSTTGQTYAKRFRIVKNDGNRIVSSDAWQNETREQIMAHFDVNGVVTAQTNYAGDFGFDITTNTLEFVAKVAGGQTDSSTSATTSTSTGLGELEINCVWSINPLTWFLCPLVEGASKVAQELDAQINNQLSIKLVDDSSGTSPFDLNSGAGQGMYGAWSAMRTIALSLLVVVALIMVISQIVSIGSIDAYTVKKVLPRIVVAVIAVSLSWQLSKIMIQFSNDFGQGIGGLISKPFDATLNNPNINGDGISLGAFGFSAAFAAGLDITVVLSLALVAMVSVLIAFLVITFRNILVILLVITAPIALVLWILPNTKKAWNLWQGNFTAVLLAFPIIVGIITSGRIFAAIASNGGDSFFTQIVIFIAYFGPYFVIPAAFKMAGGAVAQIGGIANDRSRGFFDKQKKKRGDSMHATKEKAQAGKRWNPDFMRFGKNGRSVGGMASKLAMWNSQPGLNAGYQLGKRGVPGFKRLSAGIGSELNNEAIEQSAKVLEKLNSTGMFNDKAYRAMMGGFNGFSNPEVRQGLIDAGFMDAEGNTTKMATSLSDFNQLSSILDKGGETERIAANAFRNQAGYLSTIHTDPEMGHASLAAAGAFGLASHGFATGDDLANLGNHVAKHENVGLAHAITTRAQVMGQGQRPDLKAGYGVLFDPTTGKFRNGLKNADGSVSQRGREWYETVKQQDWLGAKSGAVTAGRDIILETATERRKNHAGEDMFINNPDGTQTPAFTDRALAAQEQIQLGASAYSSSDLGAKIVWKEIASQIPGLSANIERADQFRAVMEQQGHVDGGASPLGGAPPTAPSP